MSDPVGRVGGVLPQVQYEAVVTPVATVGFGTSGRVGTATRTTSTLTSHGGSGCNGGADSGLTIGEFPIMLRSLEVMCRGEGARYEWEKLITSLVKVDHPDARNPEAISGDQGIDVVVGRVSGGDIVVWRQSTSPGSVKARKGTSVDHFKPHSTGRRNGATG